MVGEHVKEFDNLGTGQDKDRGLPYQAPAIVYEGRIDIRAGSPFFSENDPSQDLTSGK